MFRKKECVMSAATVLIIPLFRFSVNVDRSFFHVLHSFAEREHSVFDTGQNTENVVY